MRPGRLIGALCVALLMGASLGGCCSEDESTPQKATEGTNAVTKATEAPAEGDPAKKEGEQPVAEEYDPKVWEKELNEKPLRVNPSAEKAPDGLPGEMLREGQEPGDRIIELEPGHIVPVLARSGWKSDDGEGEVLKDGRRFEASKGDARVSIELVQFDTVEEADKYMFKVEKDENVAIGRAHTKFVVVFPKKKEDLSTTREALAALVPRKVEENAIAQKAPADKGAEGEEGAEAPPEGFDPKAPTEQTEPEELEEEEAPEGDEAEGDDVAPEGDEAPEKGDEAPEKGEDPAAPEGDAP